MNPCLMGTRLGKKVDGRYLIRGVTLSVTPGQCTVILGVNGAGKTVAMKALSGVDPPSEGDITLDGEVVYSRGRIQGNTVMWPRVGFVFSNPFLWPNLQVADNWRLVAESAADRPRALRCVRELSERLGVAALSAKWPNEISRGEQQRVAIVRALAACPRYLFLDEPTSHLSIEHSLEVAALIRHFCNEGMGVFVSTHMLGFAKRVSNAVVYVHAGQVVETGGSEVLMSPVSAPFRDFLTLMEAV